MRGVCRLAGRRRYRRAAIAACAAGVLAAVTASAAWAVWRQPIPDALNRNPLTAREPSMIEIGGVPHVSWHEHNVGTDKTQVRVARVNATGSAWERIADGPSPINKDPNKNAFSTSLASFGGVPWVAWAEDDAQFNTEIRVARPNSDGTAWERVVDTNSPINERTDRFADLPSLANVGGVPYIGWFEDKPCESGKPCSAFGGGGPFQVRVARLNSSETAWEKYPSSAATVNVDPDHDAAFPSVASIDGVPWVAFAEFDGTDSLEIRVVRPNAQGTEWEEVGGPNSINDSSSGFAEAPQLASIGGRTYVAWQEQGASGRKVFVRRLSSDGNAWERVPSSGAPVNSGSANQGAVGLTGIEGVPYLSWAEVDTTNTPQVRVARLKSDGSGWEEPVGGPSPINDPPDNSAGGITSLVNVGGIPSVAWEQSVPGHGEIRVARLDPDFGTSNAYPSDRSANLVTSLRTYGLSYAVGFEYGQGTTFGSDSSMTNSSTSDPDAVFREITGLTPSTLYSFRPFTTAGWARPRSRGDSSAFVTQSPAPDGGGDTVTNVFAPVTVVSAPSEEKLLIAIVRALRRVRRGGKVPVRYLLTDDATVRLQVIRGGRRVTLLDPNAKANRNTITWDGMFGGKTARRGTYLLKLTATGPAGQVDTDRARVKVLPRAGRP